MARRCGELIVLAFCLALSIGAANAPLLPPGISIRTIGDSRVFVNSQGMTLYIYEEDRGKNRSTCYFECAEIWPPALAPAGSVAHGDWTPIPRDQDTLQWAYQGSPLYTYRADRRPGEAAGINYMNYWQIAEYIPPPPAFTAPGILRPKWSRHHYLLADSQGRLVCALAPRQCPRTCAGWVPLLAGLASRRIGDWSVVHRNDQPQWAHRGRPVFLPDEASSNKVNSCAAAGGREIPL